MIWVYVPTLIVGFAGMIAASRYTVNAASDLVAGSRLPPFVVGMTVLAIGTDLPEIANSIVASWSDHGDLNVGDSVGSAATQTTLVLGLLPLIVGRMTITARGLAATGWMAVISLAFVAVAVTDGFLQRRDAVLLIGLWVTGSWILARQVRAPHQLTLPEETGPKGPLIAKALVGLVAVAGAAMIALWAIVGVAESLKLPELVVGFFLASIGTSLPELALDITAIRRGQTEMAIGDIFGSSFVDATLSVGIGPLLFPVAVTASQARPAAIAALVAIAIVTFVVSRARVHDWRTGLLFVAVYGGFFVVLL